MASCLIFNETTGTAGGSKLACIYPSVARTYCFYNITKNKIVRNTI